MAGEVYAMAVSVVGEVVRPGEPILKIVPADARLVVVAELEPIHVDQVYAGQEAVLLFSAFPARVTPTWSGRIRRVSADASRDERTGLEWYEVEVAIGGPIESEGEMNVGRLAAWAAIEAAGVLPEGELREQVEALAQGMRGSDEQAGGPAAALALTPGMAG